MPPRKKRKKMMQSSKLVSGYVPPRPQHYRSDGRNETGVYVAGFVVDLSHAFDAFPVRICLRLLAGTNVLVVLCPFWQLVEENSRRMLAFRSRVAFSEITGLACPALSIFTACSDNLCLILYSIMARKMTDSLSVRSGSWHVGGGLVQAIDLSLGNRFAGKQGQEGLKEKWLLFFESLTA